MRELPEKSPVAREADPTGRLVTEGVGDGVGFSARVSLQLWPTEPRCGCCCAAFREVQFGLLLLVYIHLFIWPTDVWERQACRSLFLWSGLRQPAGLGPVGSQSTASPSGGRDGGWGEHRQAVR